MRNDGVDKIDCMLRQADHQMIVSSVFTMNGRRDGAPGGKSEVLLSEELNGGGVFLFTW